MVEVLFNMIVGYILAYVVKSYLIYSLLNLSSSSSFLSMQTSSLLSSFYPGLLLLFEKQKIFHPDFPTAGGWELLGRAGFTSRVGCGRGS